MYARYHVFVICSLPFTTLSTRIAILLVSLRSLTQVYVSFTIGTNSYLIYNEVILFSTFFNDKKIRITHEVHKICKLKNQKMCYNKEILIQKI